MSYRADVYKVMIASPNDVPEERQLVRQVIHEWNSVHSEDRGIVLMPIGWETHSSPEMGDRAQAILNKQVLKNCDLLVAVFWTRLGSPTGESPSGTVEEIEEHLNAGKPAMIYFSSAPVHPGSIDPEQYQALMEFKESCKVRGLIEEYDDISEFREKFFRQLAQTVIRNFSAVEPSVDDTEYLQMADSPVPALSEGAKGLLIHAAKDPHGRILRIDAMGAFQVQTNGQEFVGEQTPRARAQVQAAIDQLEAFGFIKDAGDSRQVYEVTDAGYGMADILSQQVN
jgi:hypothetical protein